MNKEKLNRLLTLTKATSKEWTTIYSYDHIEIYDENEMMVCWLPVISDGTMYCAELICLARELIPELLMEKLK